MPYIKKIELKRFKFFGAKMFVSIKLLNVWQFVIAELAVNYHYHTS
jgi:hypothetical protein